MTIEVTENGETDVRGDAIPETIWIVAVTLRAKDGYTFRKVQDISFHTEEAGLTFHQTHGHIWTECGFEILNVDVVKYAQVPF